MKKNMKRLNSYTLIATALLSLAACNRGDGDCDATGTFEALQNRCGGFQIPQRRQMYRGDRHLRSQHGSQHLQGE